jgi:hypothetical protein
MTRLTQIEFNSRQPIRLPVSAREVTGWPLNRVLSQPTGLIRTLTESQCLSLAHAATPIANGIEFHKQWLIQHNAACPELVAAMGHQASHERNQHANQALELFLNLANVSSQQPTLESSHLILEQTTNAIKKFRDAGIEVPFDSKELDRQHLELDERTIELWQQQQKLTRGLEQLLSLEPNTRPIWTTDIQPVVEQNLDPETQFALAISQRGDLQALIALSNDCSQLTANQIASLVGSAAPWAGGGLPRPVAALWWQCQLKDQIERKIQNLSLLELTRRREQLMSLVESKKRAIKREIVDAMETFTGHQLLLMTKQRRLQSLRDSIAAAETANDDAPLNPVKHLQNRLTASKLESEITNLEFQLAIDTIRLKRIRGDYSALELTSNH